MDTRHEGKMLQEYLKRKRILQNAFAVKLGYKDRQSIVHYFKMPVIPAEFKDKVYKAGVVIFKEEYQENQNYKALYEQVQAENVKLTKQIVQLQADLISLLKGIMPQN